MLAFLPGIVYSSELMPFNFLELMRNAHKKHVLFLRSAVLSREYSHLIY